MSLFVDNAPKYWDAGLPVIPLLPWNSPSKSAGKRPILSEWTAYASSMPSKAMQAHWMQQFPDSNIGLPFGEASGLCAIDIDTENEEYIKAIREALPPSPWIRIGQKGMGLIFKWSGQPNFKLRDSNNNSLVEFLGKGNQMVMPPSIHPKTEKPYVSDTNLWEVLDQIALLPIDLEQVLRNALGGVAGVALATGGRTGPVDVVPQGERDIQLVRMAGYFARVVRGIDKKAKFTLVEAMDQMRSWVENFTASSSGDDMDPEKGVAKLVEYLLKEVEKGGTLPNGWDTGLTKEQRSHPAIAEIIKRNTVQRWTLSKAQSWFRSEIAQREDDPDWAMAKITELVDSLAQDENFSEMEFKAVADTIRKTVGDVVPLTKSELNKSFKDSRKGDVEAAADHEAIAQEMIAELAIGGDLRFTQGKFWQWNGSCFGEVDRDSLFNMVSKNVKGNMLARRFNDYNAVVNTMEKIVTAPLVEQLEDGINFANGFVDTKLEIHDHEMKYGKTFTMPFNYIPARAGEAHKWFEYLEQTWGDDVDYADKVMALQEAFAATMFGMGTKYQRAILLHGKARTGKTQALEVLQAMMPPSAISSISPTKWNERFQLTGMIGKTLNVCGELPEDSLIAGDKFKEIIGGESQDIEFKGRDTFKFRPIATHWFASNFLPRTRDTSEGFTRRWLILDFNRVVTDAERITDFHKVLIAEEREAIAAWALLGLERLQKQNDYTQPISHKKRLSMTVRANNSVAAFLQSSNKIRPVVDMTQKADVRTIFDSYVFYMREVSKGWSVTYERFMQMLDELGHTCDEGIDAVGAQCHYARGIKIIAPVLPH